MTSARYRRAARELAPEDILHTALEIAHPSIPTPVRVVADAANREIEGHVYAALAFRVTLSADVDRQQPVVSILVDNVGRDLVQWIERADGGAGATVRVMALLAGEDAIEWEVTLDVGAIHVGMSAVRIALGYEPLLGRRAVALRHDPQTTPGIF